MLMILGFFGALVAGAAADTMLAMRTNADQDDDDQPDCEDDEQTQDTPEASFFAFFEASTLPDAPPLDAPPADVPAADVPAQFDGLAERIHSSDAYDPPLPPEPLVAVGGDVPSALNGGALDDWLTGGTADTVLAGHGGNDVLQAGSAATHQIGGEGNDILWGGHADDRLEGGEGDDVLIAGAGSNTMMGGAGNDVLFGHSPDPANSGVNFLNGGTGDDVLVAGGGDYLNGGSGNDLFVLGDWLQNGPVVSITDFQADEDQILLQYDPVRIPVPEVEIRFDQDGTGAAQIWLNGQWIAQVAQAPNLTIDDIGLVPLNGPSLAA